MSKIFDYKFLIILGLSLVVYFLYREVEFLNKRVAKLETNTMAIEGPAQGPKPQMIDLPPPPSDEDEYISSITEEINTNETFHDNQEKDSSNKSFSNSPNRSSTKSSSKSSNSPKRSSPKRSSPNSPNSPNSPKSPIKTTIDNIIDRTIAETLHQSNDNKLNNAILMSTVNNNDENEELNPTAEELNGTVEEYSNENVNVEHIYSHDGLDSNTLDNDSLMIDSIVNMVKENDNMICEIPQKKHTVESLTKMKLDELQEMATKLNININTENGKKKKKSDLASEILSQS